ncbi:phosphoglycerol transferase [Vibrio albus]|uniref:Phosphoglycerol transferase n=1 Tax=Vibrio albus TaxID=2200953 RepID=A0A2U3B8F7_9VIBR|nr:alkaline phosphatase family protein [Vibrio albus]PWI33089.1 phosphoglycerol transferase [Vibrio albus]
MNFQKNFYQITGAVSFTVLLSAVLLLIGRVIFFYLQVDPDMLSGREVDLFRAFWVGSRFDLKVATIGFAPLFLLGLLVAAFPVGFSKLRKILPYYAAVLFFLLTTFSIGNYYYYTTFGNYIDVFVFGLFDDDTGAVLTSVWSDYPVLVALLAVAAITFLMTFIVSRFLRLSERWSIKSMHWSLMTVVVVITVLAYASLARGSLTILPLKRYHASVSDYDVLNKLTPNAFVALEWARADYNKQATFEPVTEDLVVAQMQKVLQQPTPEYTTPVNSYLAENKPHVVMALMEGFGTNVLVEDDANNNDLLGSLRPAFHDDFVFKRFLAGTTATIDTMAMMLFHSSSPNISRSSAQKVRLPSSAVLPYKKAGYEVVYITAGNAMWRNLLNYLPLQGFDRIIDENTLIREYPESEAYYGTWGVPDEFAFKYAEKLMKESEKPLMIYLLTVTNHSPFMVPENYQPKPVQPSQRLNTLLGPMAEHGKALLGAYQYANNALGDFVASVKSSALKDRTVIAATGDHRMRYLDPNQPDELAISFSVPFYLYVPDAIRSHTDFTYDEKRIGSHKDIFPTLYHASLSDADYISLGGKNLLSAKPLHNFGYNNGQVISDEGVYLMAKPDQLYPWASDGLHNLTQPEPNPTPELAAEYHKLQDYYLRWQITEGLR